MYLNNIKFYYLKRETIKGEWNKIIFQLQLYPTIFNKKDEEATTWKLKFDHLSQKHQNSYYNQHSSQNNQLIIYFKNCHKFINWIIRKYSKYMLFKSIIIWNHTTTSHQSNSTKYSKRTVQTLSILNHKQFQQIIHLKINIKDLKSTISVNILLYSSKETILQVKTIEIGDHVTSKSRKTSFPELMLTKSSKSTKNLKVINLQVLIKI